MILDLAPQPAPLVVRPRPYLTIALLTAAAVSLLVRCVSIAEPLGIDQSLWASAVRGMSRGQLLYQDVWEQRPPGIYFTYLAGFTLFGWAPSTLAWLDVLAAAVTTLLLYGIARPLGGRTAAAAAAALYAALTMPAGLYGHGGFLERSVSETFIAVCVVFAAWCAVQFRGRSVTTAAFGVGLFCGAAVVLKPNAGLYLPALLGWMLLHRDIHQRGGTEHRARTRWLIAAAAGAVVIPIATMVWLWRLGLIPEAKIAIVDFNRYYVSQGFSIDRYALDFSKAVWLRMKTNPLWLAGGIGAGAAVLQLVRGRRIPPLAALAVLWGGAAVLVIVVNGARLYNSYFIQAFPPLALMGAWLLTEVVRGSPLRRLLGLATGALMLLVLLNGQYPSKVFNWARVDFDVLRGRLDHTTYLEHFGGYANRRGYSARANAELAEYVRQRTMPDDRIFLFGINGAGVYFAADRLTAHRFLRVNFFVATDFPDPRFRLEPVVAELDVRRPRFLIFERLHSPSEMGRAVDGLIDHPAVARLLSSYQFETQIEDFTLYSRAH